MRSAILAVLLSLSAVAQERAIEPLTGRVEGRVVDGLRAPVPLASVCAVSGRSVLARTQTDGEGRFVLTRLPLRGCRVLASAPGRASGHDGALLDDLHPVGWAEVRLYDAVTLSGTVTGADGKPVAGAGIVAQSSAWGPLETPETTADASGHYHLEGVALGDTAICAFAAGFQLCEQRLDLRADHVVDMRLQTGASTTLRFQVKGASREQLASARCSFRAVRDKDKSVPLPVMVREGVPDGDGIWQVLGLPRDLQYDFAMVAIPGMTVDPEFRMVAPGQERNDLEFQAVAPASVQMKGVLVDAEGRPLPRRELRCRSRNMHRSTSAVTAEDGTFAIDSPVPKGEKFVLAILDTALCVQQAKTDEHDAIHSSNAYVAPCAPGEALRIVAAPAVLLRGRILDAAGQPAFGVAIKLQVPVPDRLPVPTFESTFTDRQGRFTIRQLNGRLDREVRLLGESPAGTFFLGGLRLPAQGEHDLGELSLVEQAEISGIVTGAEGKPAPGARIALLALESVGRFSNFGVREHTIADRAGRYRFAGLAPGRYQVKLPRGMWVTQTDPGPECELAAGDKREEKLLLAK